MKTLLSTLTLSLVSLFSVACAVSPESPEVLEGPSVEAEASAIESESARADEQNLTCPGAGTCERADYYCGLGYQSWCDTWQRCLDCEI